MAEMKITKAMVLTNIRAMAETMDMVGEIPADAVLEYCDTTLRQMKNKTAKAAEKRAEKAAEGDALTERIAGVVDGAWRTLDEIVAMVNDPEVTRGKVAHRLGKLVAEGRVEKDNLKLEGETRKVMHYRQPAVEIVVEDDLA